MTATANIQNLQQYKSKFRLIVDQILTFPSSTNLVKKAQNLPPNFKRIAQRCLKL